MNKGLLLLAVGGLVAIGVATSKREVPREPVTPITPVAPVKPVKQRQIIYVTAANCVYCVKMERETFANPKVAETLTAFTFTKTDDAKKWKVSGVPTYILLGADGKELRRGSGYKGPAEFLAWLGSREELVGASVGGKVSPDGAEIQIDLPGDLHLKNVGGSDGVGLCVFTSIAHSARWSNVGLLENFRDWMKKYPGGGYPSKVDQKIAQIAKEKGVPPPAYIQVEGGKETLEVLRAALASGRMPGVTYSFSPTKRYGGQRIAHMVSLVHLDDRQACVLDNNYPGIDKYEWMSTDEFLRTYTGGRSGWAVILLDPGPPPLPWNME